MTWGRASLAPLFALLSALVFSGSAPPASAAGVEAPGGQPPARVCSVSLAGDELLALLVPTSRVVCVSTFADDPAYSNVAGHYPESVPRLVARVEPVLDRRPDLVVAAPWNSRDFLRALERVEVPALVLGELRSFGEIGDELVRLGEALGEGERARSERAAMDARLARVDEALAGLPAAQRPRVLSLSQLVAAGSGTTIDALIARAGGVNAAAQAGIEGHKRVAAEAVIGMQPEVLLIGHEPGASLEAALEAHPALRQTPAARKGRVVLLPPRLLTSVSPYLAEGVERLARALHPERFAEREGATGAGPAPAERPPRRPGGEPSALGAPR